MISPKLRLLVSRKNLEQSQEEGSEVPTTPAQEQGEEIWLHHFGEVRKMGPGGTVVPLCEVQGFNLNWNTFSHTNQRVLFLNITYKASKM